MEEILLSLFIRYGLPYLLRKETLTLAEGLAIKAWYAARQTKFYHTQEDFPSGKNGERKVKSVSQGQPNSNINH